MKAFQMKNKMIVVGPLFQISDGNVQTTEARRLMLTLPGTGNGQRQRVGFALFLKNFLWNINNLKADHLRRAVSHKAIVFYYGDNPLTAPYFKLTRRENPSKVCRF